MFISNDEDANKILCMAQVPKDIVTSKGLKADEWCKQIQGLIGGIVIEFMNDQKP